MSCRSIASAAISVMLCLLLGGVGSPALGQGTAIALGKVALVSSVSDRFDGFTDISGSPITLFVITSPPTISELQITGSSVSYSYTTTLKAPGAGFFNGLGVGTVPSMSIDVRVTASAFEQPGGPGTTIFIDGSAITESSAVLRGFFVSGGTVSSFDIVLSGFSQGGITLQPESADPVTRLKSQNLGMDLVDSSGVAAAVPGPSTVTLSGKARGVGRGFPRGGLAMVGSFHLDRDIDLSADGATVTIVSFAFGDFLDIVNGGFTLGADPRNTAQTAYFTSAPGFFPTRVVIRDRGRGEFTFRFEMTQAFLSPPVRCPHPTLTTTFVIQDGVNAPVAVSTQQPWLCFGNQFLRTP